MKTDMKKLWEYYNINTMDGNSYAHHPTDIGDILSSMSLLEICNYINNGVSE
jgi:hypothetical protein